jgi:cytochrome oxidase Cu insertion factor (SCO1/SenC/PrrC family)
MKAWAMSSVALAVGTVALAVSAQPPQAARTPIDLSKLGPQAGDRVPDFTLSDQDGKSWTLRSLMGPKGLMLVFFRSADW